MILLQLNDISKSFDGEDIFTRVNFEVKTGERIGVVGRNGAGKSTLMKIIAGVEDYDSGHISKIKNLRMGYLTQQMTLNSSASVFEEMSKPFEHLKKMELLIREETNWLADHASNYYSEEYQQHMERYESLTNQFEQLDGYQYESKIKTVLHGLNFNEDDFDKPINDFSGGQKTRLSLAQMLLNEPDLLLLDEPTNHLDLETTKWLEDYLKYFKGAIVIISHDRYFLDKIVTQIYDVALGDVKRYVGNYEQFIEQRDKYYESRMQEYERQQDEIKRLETFVEKNITRASTSGMAKSRRKTLEKMERIDKPMLDARSANIQFGFNRNTGNDVMNIRNLKIGYDSPITSPINIEVSKGDHIAIIGPNGVGKTTTIGKLAHRYKSEGKKVLLAAGDTFRAAAIDQLEVWANRCNVDIIKHQEGADPGAVIFDAIKASKARGVDVLICDTAGRLHNKSNLMNELGKVFKIVDREYPEAKKEVLLVVDATTGQNAVSQAKSFKEVCDITGLALTKLDGTAKGGVILAVKSEVDVPVKLIGVGEKMEDLQDFDSKSFVDALFS